MRVIVLEVCASVAALLFLISFGAIVSHRAKHRCQRPVHGGPVKEYLWAAIPWVIVAAAAFPAVWPILAAP